MMNKILTGTIVVPEERRSQLIYSSQVYNTHFNVFAEFIGSENVITRINIAFVNYTGPINLGIVDIGNLLVASTDKTNFFILPITLQGLPEKGKIRTFKDFENEEFKLDSSKSNYLIVVRDLKSLSADRNSSAPAYESELDPNCIYNEVFDTEYFNRDGIRNGSFNSKNRLPKANIAQIKEEIDSISKNTHLTDLDRESEFLKAFGGYRCMYSASKIINL